MTRSMFALLFGLVCGPAVACNPEDSSIANGCRDGELAAAIIGGICGGILLLCFIACMCKGCDKEEVPCEYRLLMVIFWPLVMLYGCWRVGTDYIAPKISAWAQRRAAQREAAATAKEEKEAREEARGRNEEALARELELAERGMPISVRMLNGKQLYFVVSDRDTVAQLKELIEKRVQIPKARQKLRAPGAANGELEDDRSFGSFNHGTELHLAVGAGADAADDEGEEAHDFSVGQRVEAKYVFPGGRLSCSWYPGRIAAVHREGTYHVEYADGDAQDVNSEHIRGVEANAPADGAGDNDDAAVTITVDDGALD